MGKALASAPQRTAFQVFIEAHPFTFITAASVLLGFVFAFWPEFAGAVDQLSPETIDTLRTISRLEGFGAGCVAGFGFSTATFMQIYKKKADAYDKLMEDLAKAQIAQRTS